MSEIAVSEHKRTAKTKNVGDWNVKKIMAELIRRDDWEKITGRGRDVWKHDSIDEKSEAIEHPNLCVIVHSRQAWQTAGQDNKDCHH